MPQRPLVHYVKLFLLTINCPSKLNVMCIRLLYYTHFCMTVNVGSLKRLDGFHHRCIKTMLGSTNRLQWEEHISSATMRRCRDYSHQVEKALIRVAGTCGENG